MLEHRDLADRIIGLAIQTGPGLLESVYAACPDFELEQAGIPLLRQMGVPVFCKGMRIPLGFRADMLVADTAPALLPAHEAKLSAYQRPPSFRAQSPVGPLMNLHATRLKDRLKRFVRS